MVDSAEKLQKAEQEYARAQEALGEVGKVLAAAEQAQAAADRAREAADHAHETLRKLNKLLPVVGVVFIIGVLLARRRHSSPKDRVGPELRQVGQELRQIGEMGRDRIGSTR